MKKKKKNEVADVTVHFCVFSVVVPDDVLIVMGCANGVVLYLEFSIIRETWNSKLCINGRSVALTVNGRFDSEGAKAAG